CLDVRAAPVSEGWTPRPARKGPGLAGRVSPAPPMTRVLEHRERLAAVVDEDLPALELVPGESRVGRAGGEEKAVLLVDLGEMDGGRPLALFQWTEALRGRRLGDVRRPAHEPLDRRLAGRSDRVLRLEPRLPQEATRERGDQRRIEGGKARELDTDFVAHRDLLTLSRSRSARTRARSGGSGAGS